MSRKLKVSLVLLAALAMSAIGPQAASAHWVLEAGKEPAILTGEQLAQKVHTSQFKIKSGSSSVALECEEGLYLGTTTEKVIKHATIHPTYKKCTSNGGLIAADYTTTGCDFTLTEETDAEGHSKVDIVCNTGKSIITQITISGVTCRLAIHGQVFTEGGVVYENTAGSPDDVDATITAKGITYERLDEGTLCKAAIPNKEANDAEFETKVTVKAFEDKGCTAEFNLTEEKGSCTEGAQTTLTSV